MNIALNEACELIVDCPHSTEPDEGQGYPIIRTPNIGKGYLNLEGVQRVSKEAYDRRNKRAIPQPNDLILAREAPAGNVAIIPEGLEVCLGQRTVLIRPNKNVVNPLFLNYYLNAPEQRHHLLRNSNGATVSHVNMPIIRNLPLVLPTMGTQKRIASILSAYDELIENNRKQIKLLEEAAQRLYKEWFIGLKFPGHETTPIDPETNLPEGWRKGILSDIAEFKRGKTITAAQAEKGTIPVVAGGLEPAYYHSKANAKGPVVTISASGANAGFTRLYTTNIWASDCSFLSADASRVFLFVYESVKCIGRNFKHLQRGSAQPHVYPSHINSMEMLIPTVHYQVAFCETVKPFISQISILHRSIEDAKEARDRLLPKLMSGEIEVN